MAGDPNRDEKLHKVQAAAEKATFGFIELTGTEAAIGASIAVASLGFSIFTCGGA
jgi:hypothetical protein